MQSGAPEPNSIPPVQESELTVQAEFTCLNRGVIHLWRVQHLISSSILLFLAMIAGLLLGLNAPQIWPWILGGWVGLGLLRVWLWFWYPPRAYSNWGYRLDARVLEIRNGIFFRVIQLLPLSRLQHVDLHRGPLERYFGLSSLLLYTAGTHEAVLTIPGLGADEAIRLRDQLVALGEEHGA